MRDFMRRKRAKVRKQAEQAIRAANTPAEPQREPGKSAEIGFAHIEGSRP